MNRTTSSVWLLSIAVLALGYLFIDRPLHDQLAQAEQDRDRTVAETDRNVAVTHDAAALRHQLASLRARLASVDLESDSVGLVGAFVGEATTVARVAHVRVIGFDGRPLTRAATLPVGKVKPPAPSAFTATTIELTIEGSYANLVTALRQLSHQRVPVRVDVASIERTADPRRRGEPLLDARIRVDILHRNSARIADAAAS